MKKPTPTNLKRNCDDRMRKFITALGMCERCGDPYGPFECAHVVRRRFSWTRTDERNAWCLCLVCHKTVDTSIIAFNELVAKTIGWDTFAELEAKSERREKFDWSAELARWKELT